MNNFYGSMLSRWHNGSAEAGLEKVFILSEEVERKKFFHGFSPSQNEKAIEENKLFLPARKKLEFQDLAPSKGLVLLAYIFSFIQCLIIKFITFYIISFVLLRDKYVLLRP